VQSDPEVKKKIDDYIKKTKEDTAKAYANALKKMSEKTKAEKKKSSKKLGSISISNTDTVSRCLKVKARLAAKLGEIYSSDLDPKLKNALARDVMIQIEKVEVKISEIQRRERAVAEEKRSRKNESAFKKRQRQMDMAKKTAQIRRDYLYSAEEGGMDPASYMPGSGASDAAVSFDIAGMTGTVTDAAAAIVAEAMGGETASADAAPAVDVEA
jgi:hypothetical protein